MKKALLKHVALMAGAALSAGTCFVSCIDDEPVPNRIEIFTEQFSNSRKMTVEHQQVHWVDGDRIYISGTEAELSVSDGHVYANDVAATSPIRALFPTGLTTSAPTSDEVQITLPAEYHYRKTGNLQKLDMPMAAYATGTDTVQFKHLTGALCLMITNSDIRPLTLERITICSNSYQLSGNRTVNFQSLTNNNGAVEAATDADRSVSLLFDIEPVEIAGNNADTTFVVLPIPAVGDANKFTVEVSTYNIDYKSRYIYQRTQSTGGALARNEIGYVPVQINTGGGGNVTREPLFSRDTPPYLINSYYDFLLFVRAVNTNTDYRKSHFSLTSNIDCAGLILNSPIKYSGIMDGQGHCLNNIGVEGRISGNDYYCSLFDSIKEVKNLTLNNFTLKLENGSYTNLYAGCFQSKVDAIIIRNCHINNLSVNTDGDVATSYTLFGNFVGQTRVATIDSCSFSGFVNESIPINSNTIHLGGIIGMIHDNTSGQSTLVKNINISNCNISYDENNPFTITGNTNAYVGGAIGRGKTTTNKATELTISNCSFALNFNIQSTTVIAGGIAGSTANNSEISFPNNTNTIVSGTINNSSVDSYLAGIIGKYYSSNGSSINDTNNCSYDSLIIIHNGNPKNPVNAYN